MRALQLLTSSLTWTLCFFGHILRRCFISLTMLSHVLMVIVCLITYPVWGRKSNPQPPTQRVNVLQRCDKNLLSFQEIVKFMRSQFWGLKYKTLTLILGLLVSIQKFCYIKSNTNRLQKLAGSLNLLFLSRGLKKNIETLLSLLISSF